MTFGDFGWLHVHGGFLSDTLGPRARYRPRSASTSARTSVLSSTLARTFAINTLEHPKKKKKPLIGGTAFQPGVLPRGCTAT